MKVLNIRNLPDAVHKALRLRAAEHDRSMEAEARDIIARAVLPRKLSGEEMAKRLQEAARQAFGGKMPEWTVDDFIAERRREAQKEFDEMEADVATAQENS